MQLSKSKPKSRGNWSSTRTATSSERVTISKSTKQRSLSTTIHSQPNLPQETKVNYLSPTHTQPHQINHTQPHSSKSQKYLQTIQHRFLSTIQPPNLELLQSTPLSIKDNACTQPTLLSLEEENAKLKGENLQLTTQIAQLQQKHKEFLKEFKKLDFDRKMKANHDEVLGNAIDWVERKFLRYEENKWTPSITFPHHPTIDLDLPEKYWCTLSEVLEASPLPVDPTAAHVRLTAVNDRWYPFEEIERQYHMVEVNSFDVKCGKRAEVTFPHNPLTNQPDPGFDLQLDQDDEVYTVISPYLSLYRHFSTEFIEYESESLIIRNSNFFISSPHIKQQHNDGDYYEWEDPSINSEVESDNHSDDNHSDANHSDDNHSDGDDDGGDDDGDDHTTQVDYTNTEEPLTWVLVNSHQYYKSNHTDPTNNKHIHSKTLMNVNCGYFIDFSQDHIGKLPIKIKWEFDQAMPEALRDKITSYPALNNKDLPALSISASA
jgi:hypothetical protein